MICLINFKEALVITREEAKEIKVNFEECNKVGVYDNRPAKMNAYNYYRDELDIRDGKYYKDEEEISSYYIYDRPEKTLDWVYVPADNHLVNLEEFALSCKYPFYISKTIRSEEPTVQNIQSLLNKIEEKTQQIDKTIDIMKQQAFNQKVNVHVGGGLIVTYNDLCLKEDCCTDELQNELNNGWRILAVCVQSDQRRPDYILGRYNPELDVYGKPNAKR